MSRSLEISIAPKGLAPSQADYDLPLQERGAVYVYWGFHAACLFALWTGVTWGELALCAALVWGRMLAITAGYHRYFAHRSYKTSRPFAFLLALVACTAVQKGPLWWAAGHRRCTTAPWARGYA